MRYTCAANSVSRPSTGSCRTSSACDWGLEERGVQNAPRVVEIVLALEPAAVLQQRPGPEPRAEVPAGIERLVVTLHQVPVAVGVVAAGPAVVLEREAQAVAAPPQAGEAIARRAVAAIVGAYSATETEVAGSECGFERLGLNGAQGSAAPSERVGAAHHTERSERVRTDMAQAGVHPGRPGRKGPRAVDEDADLFRIQAPDRRIQVDGPAPEGRDAGMAPQRLRQILRHAPFNLRRRHDHLGRHFRHERDDGHLLGERADLKRDGDRRVAPRIHGRLGWSESEQRRLDHVGAALGIRKSERAVPIRMRRSHKLSGLRPEHHRHAGQRNTLNVRHRSAHTRRLRLCSRRQRKAHHQQRRCQPARPSNPRPGRRHPIKHRQHPLPVIPGIQALRRVARTQPAATSGPATNRSGKRSDRRETGSPASGGLQARGGGLCGAAANEAATSRVGSRRPTTTGSAASVNASGVKPVRLTRPINASSSELQPIMRTWPV